MKIKVEGYPEITVTNVTDFDLTTNQKLVKIEGTYQVERASTSVGGEYTETKNITLIVPIQRIVYVIE